MTTKEELTKHLNAQHYDKHYQDILPINLVGYSQSFKTWQRLEKIIQWRGKTIVDLGCFHGYFCFRAAKMGASSVIGLDALEAVLITARMIAKLEQCNTTEFREWKDTDPIPRADVTLCLNALHHFPDPLICLRNINSEITIFEVPNAQEELISSAFEITGRFQSHRKRRTIFTAKRKP